MSTQNETEAPLAGKAVPPSPFMQCFWDLASIEEASRVDAVTRLVDHALEAQNAFERMGSIASGGAGADAGAADALGLCSDVHYAVKRCGCSWQSHFLRIRTSSPTGHAD